jgi:predicted phage terminase large subunit-like protein
MTRDEAARELQMLEAEIARRRLLDFTRYTFPKFVPYWHHRLLAEKLEQVIAGRTKRLMIFMPPQHGKTELASRRLPAYLLGRFPDMRVVFGTYNHERAQEVGRDVQRIIDGDDYKTLFPDTRLASGSDFERRTAARFDVVGHTGYYLAAGVGQRIAGKSMDIGIIDDPVGSRADAESDAYRKAVWDWWVNDITSRQLGVETKLILIMTRWHEDDLAGRLLQMAKDDARSDQWEVLNLPALAESESLHDPRKTGEALWPERFPLGFLEQRRALGVYEFSSLYQQRPVPAGGAMAKREWFPILPAPKNRGDVLRWCRGWDMAATIPAPGKDPDWTAGVRLGQCSDGKWLIADVSRDRTTPDGADKLMAMAAIMDPPKTLIREEQEGGSAGKAVISAHTKKFAGKDYAGVRSGATKVERWRPFLAQAEAGNVQLERGPWNTEFINEMITLPYGKHDDQADAVSLAFNELTAYQDYGATAAVVMPNSYLNKVGDKAEWRRKYF